MTPRVYKTGAALLALAVLTVLATTGWAGESKFQGTLGANFFSVSPACPAKRLPTFESIAPVPSIIDPFEQDLIPFSCEIQVDNEGKGAKGVKGKYEADLVVIDNNTGQAESFPVGSGKFRTNSSGRASFDFELPTELFADGFESGDVSAWSYTRTDFTNRKRASGVSQNCQTGTSRSN